MGQQLFTSMIKDYNIEPKHEHYGCMVNLLGRANCLKDAFNVIESMSIAPNVVVWGSLLSACRVHGEVKMGKFATKCLLEIDPDHDEVHVMLLNIYVKARRWRDIGETTNNCNSARYYLLIVYHYSEQYKKNSKMIEYAALIANRMSKFAKETLDYLSQGENRHADSLAYLAKVLGTEDRYLQIEVISTHNIDRHSVCAISTGGDEEEDDDWRKPFTTYLGTDNEYK
ncbi:hypothetical protein GIB67_006082 [Kingdonia uniflora]|uniref:Pentatricopeptide repeat-containing protein n=1 Tax=Kingdonia uniflora TaxID=39325 RepID=A0A7J7LPW5_9MAGN|nr:hypothetical protein GIB67_006082 [Kingdonia uniflora]